MTRRSAKRPAVRVRWELEEYTPAGRWQNFLLILQTLAAKIEARPNHAEDAPKSDEYGSDFISITDEDGKEYELEVLAELEYEGSKYLALVPADDDGEEDLEVSILKAVDENGEEILVTIDDDDELEAVYSALMDLMYEDEEEEPSET